MRGSIQKKGNTYYAVIAINGKRKWFRGGSVKKQAEKVLTDKLNEIDKGIYREVRKITFKDFSLYGLGTMQRLTSNRPPWKDISASLGV